ncbi:MAG: hypothetical protein F4Y53_06160, partial [Proteobacteria bacterium]|nr:hypothetical protein [Pseudomonadota bacterium]
MSRPKTQNKLATARTRLILDKPFLGALVLRLPLVAADPGWCKTASTDARKLYFNPEYIGSLDIQETQFVLAKQALHCALSHFARRHHRIRSRWELACDYAVNPLLIHDGLKPPPGTPVEENFEGMTAEEIYHCIDQFDDETSEFEKPSDSLGDEGSHGPQQNGQSPPPQESSRPEPDHENEETQELARQPAELTAQQQEDLYILWQQRLAGAALQA